MAYITDIRTLNAERIALLIDCCIQAYKAFDTTQASTCRHSAVSSPQGYELLDSWSGVDSIFGGDKTVESYGLVFRSTSAPWRYIFAFRGTDSALDMLDDCGANPQAFVPFAPTAKVPGEVRVETGFNDIYRSAAANAAPMQQQLFELIDRYQASSRPIDELLVTGHSLGAALSLLFTLDLSLSNTGLAAENINFASPRVGNEAFVDLIEQRVAQPVLRVQNIHDAVPHLPPEELGFRHTPAVYRIAFRSNDLLGKRDVLASHSSINYRAVLQCALQSPGGICSEPHLSIAEGIAPICSEPPQ